MRDYSFNDWVETKYLFYCMNPVLSTVMTIYTDLKPTLSWTLDVWIVYFKLKKLFFFSDE